jgi:hypothetical protein
MKRTGAASLCSLDDGVMVHRFGESLRTTRMQLA